MDKEYKVRPESKEFKVKPDLKAIQELKVIPVNKEFREFREKLVNKVSKVRLEI